MTRRIWLSALWDLALAALLAASVIWFVTRALPWLLVELMGGRW